MNRGITILLASGATVLAVLAVLLVPLSIAVGHLANVVGEVIIAARLAQTGSRSRR